MSRPSGARIRAHHLAPVTIDVQDLSLNLRSRINPSQCRAGLVRVGLILLRGVDPCQAHLDVVLSPDVVTMKLSPSNTRVTLPVDLLGAISGCHRQQHGREQQRHCAADTATVGRRQDVPINGRRRPQPA